MFAFAVGKCLCCPRVFSFNPVRVPSFRVNGVKEPICRECMVLVNVKRKEAGVPEFEIQPDAYDAVDESELG